MATFQHPGALREAQRLIQLALDAGATHLDLSSLRLRQLPEEIATLAAQLLSLDLSRCRVLKRLNGIGTLTRLERLNIERCESLTSFSGIEMLEQLIQVNVSHCQSLTSLAGIERLSQLKQLNLSWCSELTHLSGIETLSQLTHLDLSWCSKLSGLTAIKQLSKLTHLSVSHSKILNDLTDFEHLSQLVQLTVTHCNALTCLDGVQYLSQLSELNVDQSEMLAELSGIETLSNLTKLSLNGCEALTDLTRIKALTQLTELSLDANQALKSLVDIKYLSQLTKLSIARCPTITSLAGIEYFQNLCTLNVGWCTGLTSLAGLESISQLTELTVFNCQAFDTMKTIKKLTKLKELDVSYCDELKDLSGIEHLTQLTSLQIRNCETLTSLAGIETLSQLTYLDISRCEALTSLAGIEKLAQLKHLYMPECKTLSSLTGIEHLTNLTQLDIGGCPELTRFDELASLVQLKLLSLGSHLHLTDLSILLQLPELKVLIPYGHLPTLSWDLAEHLLLQLPRLVVFVIFDSLSIEHVPAELASDFDQTSIEDWWFECQQHGIESPKSLKVMLLGNGRIGKTQLARKLRGDAFDESVPSTHGIQIHRFQLPKSDIEINSWDFGGQDVYLGTHSLFIDQRALYLLLWHPDFENNDLVPSEQLLMRNRPLSYWLAYLKSLAGDKANVLVCQSQCDSPESDRPAPIPHPHPFPALRPLTISTKVADGLDVFKPSFERAVKQQLQRIGEVWLPKSWLAVEREIRLISDHNKLLSYVAFTEICLKYQVAAPDTLANYLHQSGALFYRQGHFGNQLILDQQWALQGVYLLLDRQHVLPQLQAGKGRFSVEMLNNWLSQHQLDNSDSGLFMEMMQQCGACFKVDATDYIAPDTLPELDGNEAQQIWQHANADIELELQYVFLHDATMRFLLSKIGQVAKAHAYYWRYGCCFYDSKHQVKVWFQCQLMAAAEEKFSNFGQPGKIIIRLAGSQSHQLAKHLLGSIINTHHLGQSPEVNWIKGDPLAGKNEPQERKQAEPFSDIGPAALPLVTPPSIYFSYAWGKEEDARQQASDQLYDKLKAENFNVFRDKDSTRSGNSIADFERQIGRADFAVVILSHKYLFESAHCMKELAFLYERSQRQQQSFTQRVIPVVLQEVSIDKPTERLRIVKHWIKQMEELQALVDEVGPESAGGSSVEELQLMRAFINSCADVLSWISGLVTERQQELQVPATLGLVKTRITAYLQNNQ